jgi:hypothetical protein
MAAYWAAVGVYSGHIARSLGPAPRPVRQGAPTSPKGCRT